MSARLLVLCTLILGVSAFVPRAFQGRWGFNSRIRFRLEAVKEAKSPGQFDQFVGDAGEKLLIVDYSTTWCGPCKMMAPKFEDMSKRYGNAVFVKVVGDSTPETGQLLKREGVRSVPAFHFWKGGKRIDSISGADPEKLEDVIAQNL